MVTYTPALVERLLRNYLDIRNTFEGRAQRLHDASLVKKTIVSYAEKPLGSGNRPYPFMERQHVASPPDGKRRARSMEDLHCSVIDIEDALAELYQTCLYGRTENIRFQAQEDYFFLINYYILHLYTLDELMELRGVSSRGSMQKRVFRAVQRLTKIMES
jgi:hypothetical protein